MRLGENIAKLRKQRGLTQEQLAHLLNVSETAVSKWENGNNRPDIQLLPDMADVFQVSIDSLLGYEKSYRNLDKSIKQIEDMLFQEQYDTAMERLKELIKSYPNDFRANKLLGDCYYSIIFSKGIHQESCIDSAVFYYERSIELFEEKYSSLATVESLEIQIATLFMMAGKNRLEDAVFFIKKYNQNGTYDTLLAQCLYESGKKEEAKAVLLRHCISSQVFVFNDFSALADMFEKDGDIKTAIAFLEKEVELYLLFMDPGGIGNYADRAYAGKAEIISQLYKKINDPVQADHWHQKAVHHAKRYLQNPTMYIASLRYCENVPGRMIDSYQEQIKSLAEEERK